MTEETTDTGTTGQQANGKHPDGRRPAVNTGNPRITVAFPLSRIDIREPSEALRDLAAMVEQLAEQVATLARQVAPDHVEATDQLAAQAALLARRIGSGT
jgi:hypothetical protein